MKRRGEVNSNSKLEVPVSLLVVFVNRNVHARMKRWKVIWFHWSIWTGWPLDDVFNSFSHFWWCAENLSSFHHIANWQTHKHFSTSDLTLYIFWNMNLSVKCFGTWLLISLIQVMKIKFIGLGTCKFYKDNFCNFYNLVTFDEKVSVWSFILESKRGFPSYITTAS